MAECIAPSGMSDHCMRGPQAIIGNYAVPILEEKQVWGTNDQTRTAYLDTTDVARMTLASLRCTACSLSDLAAAGFGAQIAAEAGQLWWSVEHRKRHKCLQNLAPG